MKTWNDPGWGLLVGFLLAASPVALRGGPFSSSSEARGPALLQGGMGARAAGMADAFVGVADDATAVYWNPAGLNQIPTMEFLFEHREAFGGVQQESVAFVRPVWWKNDRRTWGASLSYLSGSSFDIVDSGSVSGSARPWDGTVGFSYSQKLGLVDAGSTVKVVHQKLFEKSAQAYAVDAGVLGRALAERLSWGVSLANVGTALEWGSVTTELPTVLRGGLAYRFFPGQDGKVLLTSGQLDLPVDGATTGRLGIEFTTPLREAMGAALRAGYQTGKDRDGLEGLSLGMGIMWRSFRFDYAFAPHGELDDAHLLGMSIGFGGPLIQEAQRTRLMNQARREMEEGKLVNAQATVEEVLKVSPRHGPARRLAGDIQERFADSVDPETLFTLSYHAYQEKKLDTAVDLLQRLLVVQPEHADGKALLAQAGAEQAAAQAAVVEQSAGRAKRKELAGAVSRAEDHMKKSQWSDALKSWRRVLLLEPGHARATAATADCRESLYVLGLKAQLAGDPSAALSYFRAAQQGTPSYKDTAARLRTLEEVDRSRRKEEAQRAYTDGVRAYGEGHLEEARTLLKKAVDLQPDNLLIRRALESVEEELRHRSSGPKAP